MKRKNIYIRLIPMCIFIFLKTNAYCFQGKDSLSQNVTILVTQLDSITKVDSIIELNNYKCLRFTIFKKLYKIANKQELFYLIRNHRNPAIKGYAYLGLLVLDDNNKNVNVIYKKSFKKVGIKVSDVLRIYKSNQANDFMKFAYSSRKRLKYILMNSKTNMADKSEPKVIEMENKIKDEQK
jgi:hypothetical protein